MAEILQPRVFRKIRLNVNGNNIHQGVEKLESLARLNHPGRRFTRELTIWTLSPEYKQSFNPFKFRKTTNSVNQHPNSPLEIKTAKDKVHSHLYDAITSLRAVHTVTWGPNAQDGQNVYHIVMNALKELPVLRRIRLHVNDFDIPLQLDSLSTLSELAVYTHRCSSTRLSAIVDNVAKAVVRNPELTSIELVLNPDGIPNDSGLPQSFSELLKHQTTTMEPLRLRHIKLTSCLLLLDKICAPHLTHLTSLTLFKVDPVGLWESFIAAGIHLTEISIDGVTHAFLKYLSTYVGLKELLLKPNNFTTDASSDAMAEQFYTGSYLENHFQSLEEFEVDPPYEGLWCYGSHNHDNISKLGKLRRLAMSIRYIDVASNGRTQTSTTDLNPVGRIVNMAIHCMPDVEIIELDSSTPNIGRGPCCGTGMFEHRKLVCKKIVECAEEYIAPSSCTRIPSLRIGSWGKLVLIGKRKSSGGEENSDSTALGYVNVTPKDRFNILQF
ncbi:hypothetical protein JR316_0005473 [Psilocybe cubensis]|uniref:Uncharacterized protein n=2 Tax=Psilocybe cubensis TaxID=181762 RepID=A0ACB8H6Q4_PSICU|nr:hypothetical protein JR316_0005473 [Psilocybe cubensis]KAH9483367.1 hypothetical protein JR316_0005473 [Psilocybe cubensis]